MNTDENKKKIIMLFIALGMIVTIITGVTFSYLAPTINNLENESTVAFNAGVIAIDFKNGTNQIEVSDILPGWSETKTFSLTATNTTSIRKADAMNYSLKLIVESNTFSDNVISVSLKSTNTSNNGTIAEIIPGTLLSGASEVSLGFGSFDATKEIGEAGAIHDFELTVSFPEQYRSQNRDMGKHLSAHVTIGRANDLGTLTIADNYEKTNITTSVEKNKEVTLLSLYRYPVDRYLSIVSGDGTINANKLTLKSDEMKVAINYPSITNTISILDKTENGLEQDDTTDKNLRYVGASTKNYLKFNGEIWRIIGVFNNITTIDEEQGKEKKESLVKIIRNESLGDYSWDSSESTKNYGHGINEWSQADLMTELNTDYINPSPKSETTLWFDGLNNRKNGTYEYKNNIKSDFIDKVAKVRWNLAGYLTYSVSALNMYNAERGTLHISNPSDGITRKDYWDGKIALIYPSDYGYASTDTTCRGNLNSHDSNYNGYCQNENWLFNGGNQWTLSPRSGYADVVFDVRSGGYVYSNLASYTNGVRPVLFLKSDVVIAGGTGDEKDPYTVSNYNAFRDDSWETIAATVKVNPAAYAVGSTKKLKVYDNPNGETINGTYKEYTVRVANNTTPAKCNDGDFSQTACGFVIEFADIVESRQMNSTNTNVGGWPASEMRTYANNDFFNKLPEDLRNVIIKTKVVSGHGGADTSNFPSTDKIYLLSAHEVYEDGTSNQVSTYDSAWDKTRQLDYYRSKGVTTSNYSSAKKTSPGSGTGIGSYWWLRATISNNLDCFRFVYSSGSCGTNNASTTYGVSPAFRIG